VWNRTRARAEAFAERHSAKVADTPAAAAAGNEIAVTMVVDGPQVERVLLADDGVAAGARRGLLCVDCSTIGPAATRAISERLSERGVTMVDAPVTGSSPKAENGTLTIMVGGTREDFERCRPLLDAMGELIVYCGALGQGQMVKLINNAVAASNAAIIAQALLVGARTGVDLDALIEVMRAGSGASAMLDLKARPMREHDYTTLFKLAHMLKDVRLCLEEGEAAGVPFPFAALTREILTAASGLGHGDDDFAALIEPLEGLAGGKL
jgi:3-hydroxyisobutyrate dehydrogenase-like beta-hydroxyacid dehydrogenase